MYVKYTFSSDTITLILRRAAPSWSTAKVQGDGPFPVTVAASKGALSEWRRMRIKPGWQCWRKPQILFATSAATSKRSTSYERCGGGQTWGKVWDEMCLHACYITFIMNILYCFTSWLVKISLLIHVSFTLDGGLLPCKKKCLRQT